MRPWTRETDRLAVALASVVGAKRQRNQTLKRQHGTERVVEAAVEVVRFRHAALAVRTPSASSMPDASSGSGRPKR